LNNFELPPALDSRLQASSYLLLLAIKNYEPLQ